MPPEHEVAGSNPAGRTSYENSTHIAARFGGLEMAALAASILEAFPAEESGTTFGLF